MSLGDGLLGEMKYYEAYQNEMAKANYEKQMKPGYVSEATMNKMASNYRSGQRASEVEATIGEREGTTDESRAVLIIGEVKHSIKGSSSSCIWNDCDIKKQDLEYDSSLKILYAETAEVLERCT